MGLPVYRLENEMTKGEKLLLKRLTVQARRCQGKDTVFVVISREKLAVLTQVLERALLDSRDSDGSGNRAQFIVNLP